MSSRVTEAVLKGAYAGEQGTDYEKHMLNLKYGGQFGHSPHMGIMEEGVMRNNWLGDQPYVSVPVRCLLLEAPGFFELMPQPEHYYQTLKALMEKHVTDIQGLNATITNTFVTQEFGAGGEIFEEIADSKRSPSTPTCTWIDKRGRPIQNFFEIWSTYGGMDPETKIALVGTLDSVPTGKEGLTGPLRNWLSDMYTMTCLFYETDRTGRVIDKSWLCANMFPKGFGDITAHGNKNAAGELLTLGVEFTALSQFNLGGNSFAQKLLDEIDFTNANPAYRRSFIEQVNEELLTKVGYKETVDELRNFNIQ